ncbi:hypothetical protein D9756_005918 [Leucocoprinus leucothites]|uniref:Uncharacterized protein n=1 Tax=Leucocoprinus leucothites TaxID=201217 RepID=A0A8H5D3V8_9AGAR|nr:hypothetical protein D9756_005918 [Leucoagaricus leucothites]
MCVAHSIRRLIQAALVVSILAFYLDVKRRYTPVLQLDSRSQWRPTYAPEASGNYFKPYIKHPRPPDTTAVILNWSRLPNVVQLAKVMCSSLQDTLAEVFIWNNNPNALTKKDLAEAQCPGYMLKIYNSPKNIYFQARFLACARATTPYCFIQDDDYFVQPSIIRTMRARMSETTGTSLHLLPSHEMLYSRLSTIEVEPTIRTLFAWLGYGTMTRRSEVQEFMGLLETLNATEDVLRMSDNYFTVLSNRLPELWFDQNYELGGGTPFTVGTVGEERNNLYIMDAGSILDSLAMQSSQALDKDYPYISLPTPNTLEDISVARAACSGSPCVMETNIELLPAPLEYSVSLASDIIAHVKNQFIAIGTNTIEHYLRCSPSFAVDVDPQTSFCSAADAKEGDWISLDWMIPSEEALELALLVDQLTVEILKHCQFESSVDGKSWQKLSKTLKCSKTKEESLKECSIVLGRNSLRKVRMVLERSVPHEWTIHEMWLRRSE